MRLITVLIDSIVSLDDGRSLTNIWNPTVSRDPPSDPAFVMGAPDSATQSGTIENPDGKRATQDESPPFITTVIDCTSTAAYTMSDPVTSVVLS